MKSTSIAYALFLVSQIPAVAADPDIGAEKQVTKPKIEVKFMPSTGCRLSEENQAELFRIEIQMGGSVRYIGGQASYVTQPLTYSIPSDKVDMLNFWFRLKHFVDMAEGWPMVLWPIAAPIDSYPFPALHEPDCYQEMTVTYRGSMKTRSISYEPRDGNYVIIEEDPTKPNHWVLKRRPGIHELTMAVLNAVNISDYLCAPDEKDKCLSKWGISVAGRFAENE